MKRRSYIIIGVLLILGCVYWGVYRLTTNGPRKLLHSDQPELAWLKQEFSLNDEQFGKIKSIHAKFDAECYEMCQNLAESQEQLHVLIAGNATINREVENALARTTKLREHCRQATLHYMYEISSVMTPEQAERYRETMSRSMMTTGRVPHLSDPGKLHNHILHHDAAGTPVAHD